MISSDASVHSQSAPCISVIVAAEKAGSPLLGCPTELDSQVAAVGGEVLLVTGDARIASIVDGLHTVRVLPQSAEANIPQMWQAGIEAAAAPIVVLTIAECIPAKDWVLSILEAHKSDFAAVGGAVEMQPGLGLVDSAVYFTRYSSYIPPFAARFSDDMAADNCSYKREALAGLEAVTEEGFWETFVHRAMRARGQSLRIEPSVIVNFAGGFSWWGFLSRRLVHGRYFANRQARGWSRGKRLVRGIASAVVPLLLMGRIAARVWRNGRYRGRFVASMPIVASFAMAWAAGEAIGYWLGTAPVAQTSDRETRAVGAI